MKILLLGANGQVGWELRRALAPLGQVTATDRHSEPPLAGNLEDIEPLRQLIRHLRPDVIVNAAAYTAVDAAEADFSRAQRVNAAAPGALAREAALIGAALVHFSTDYVFDGSGDQPWREDDATAPINAYGRTKLEGEDLIRGAGCHHLILRTSWVYAARGRNFLHTMLRLATERDRLTVIDDQTGAPTSAELIADVTAHAIRQLATDGQLSGTYHLAADGAATWHAYARHLIGEARRLGRAIRVADDAIVPCRTADFPTAARRPLNSRLSTTKLRKTFGLELPPWQAGVERVLMELCTR